MSKTITEKIKGILEPEDLVKFEGMISSMIKEGVEKKVQEISSLQEEELKKKYDTLAEKYIAKELSTLVEEEKAKLVSTYDKKLAILEEKVVSKLDSFLQSVIMEQISDAMIEKVAINETLLPLVNNLKDAFTQHHIELDSEGEKVVRDLTESHMKVDKELSESISKTMELEERLEKAAVFLMISEKTNGLPGTQKKKVIEMFTDKKFNDVEKNIDNYVTLIKEGTVSKKKVQKINESKKVDKVVSSKVGLEEDKKTVVAPEVIDEVINENDTSMSDAANRFLFD
jgi:hypothetical protein